MEEEKKNEEGTELESRFIQMLIQNGLWAWEFDMRTHEIIKYSFLKRKDPYGYAEEIIQNVPDSIIARGTIYKDDIPLYRQLYERIYKGENQVSVQVRAWTEERQEYVWNQLTFTVIHNANGEPVRALCSSRDISEVKQIEQHFMEENRYWDEISSSMIATGRRNLTTGRWEKVIIHGMGITLPEELQKTADYRARASYFLFQVGLSEEDNKKLMPEALMHQYAKGIRNTSVEYNARTMEKGEPICVRVDCRVLKRPQTGDLIAFYYESDITQEFCINSIMNSIINYEYDLVGVLFAASNSIYSKAKENKTSLPELKSNNFNEVSEKFLRQYACEENMDELVRSMQIPYILEKLQESDAFIEEFSVREPNGKIRRKEIRFSYISREEQMIAVSRRDIHDIVQAEKEKQEQLEQALNLAEQANNAKSEFLSRMSHEMRTPMNAIIGLVALAERETEKPEVLKDYLGKIQASGRLLMNLINDVLDMSKIESGKMELHFESCCFDVLIDGIQSVILPLCEQKKIRFVEEGQRRQDYILVDRLRLQQVLLNLLSNAVKFTPEGGDVCFKCRSRREEKELAVEFEVADNGIGMSKEFQKKMFFPFTQEEREGTLSVQGTGLGLAISKAIIDKMGGTIQVDSHLGAGTRFIIRIRFPLAEERNTEHIEQETRKRMEDALCGRQVLLVEDHPMNQLIARRILQNSGIKVVTADNGAAAVELFRSHEPGYFDLILMDIRMPVMDGITAAKVLRELPREDARTIPIIAMTANAFEEDVQKTREAGMNFHLAKPIEPTLLLKTLNEWIGR